MADIFDKLFAAGKQAASSVATGVNVAAQEQKIREAYQTLGKLYFQAKRRGEAPEGLEFADQCREIEARLKRIEEMKNRQNVTDYADRDDFVDVN